MGRRTNIETRFKKGNKAAVGRRPQKWDAARAYVHLTMDVISPRLYKNHVLLVQHKMVEALGGKITQKDFSKPDPEAKKTLAELRFGLDCFKHLSTLIMPSGLPEYLKAMNEEEDMSLSELTKFIKDLKKGVKDIEELKKMGFFGEEEAEPQEAEFEEVEERSSD